MSRKKAAANPENSNENRSKRTLPAAAVPYQFKPGQSGNPGGRPKKKPVSDAYARIMSDPAKADELAQALFDAAKAGNVNAARELREGIQGKALQEIRMEGELGLSTPEERKSRMVELLRRAANRLEGMPI